MKIRSLTIHIPAPRAEETPDQVLRRRLIAASSTAELRRRLAARHRG